MTNFLCPVCGTPAQLLPKVGDRLDIDSPGAGGRYAISGTAEVMWPTSITEQQRTFLKEWIAEKHREGDACPVIHSEILKEATAR